MALKSPHILSSQTVTVDDIILKHKWNVLDGQYGSGFAAQLQLLAEQRKEWMQNSDAVPTCTEEASRLEYM